MNMKMSTSPGGKKLKQVRLSFGPTQPSPPKKPKLETQPEPIEQKSEPTVSEPLPPADTSIVISDDESTHSSSDDKSCPQIQNLQEKLVNPYVSLVDIALKRKLKRKCTKTDHIEVNNKIKEPPSPNDLHESKRVKIDDNVTQIESDQQSDNESEDDKAESQSEDEDSSVKESNEESANDEKKDTENKNNEPITPKSNKNANRKLTPKQIEKKMESAKRRAQREQEKKMRDLKKMEEKEEKMRLKQEREEQKRLEKEEMEKAKEEARQLREMKRIERLKNEENKKKLKEAKEIDKQKKQEEERIQKEKEKEELENKKKKAATAFMSFFVPKEKENKNKDSSNNMSMDDSNHNYLSNFTIKSDMRLAPIVRNRLEDDTKAKLDILFKNQDNNDESLYLKSLKSGSYKSKSSGKTWPLEDLKNELVIVEDDLPPVDEDSQDNQVIVGDSHVKTTRPKLLLFSENRRPPYWGTWSKKTTNVTGRRPFAMDKTYLDYDCDSDEEWEEEEPGESVESVAGSDDEEDDNEYDVDNEFMVPHGYLSDEELVGEEDNVISPETQKAKLKFLEHEFEDEMKKTTKLKQPRLIGIFWQSKDGDRPACCPNPVWDFLYQKKILSAEDQIVIQSNVESNAEIEDGEKSAKKTKKIAENMIPDLIKLIHGNTNNKGFMCKEFQLYLSKSSDDDKEDENVKVSKMSIGKKIRELSMWIPCPEEGPMHTKMCWFVDKEIRDKYQLDLKLPNEWSYTLTPKRRNLIMQEKILTTANDNKNQVKDTPLPKKENAFNITKFTKILTQEEREKQFVATNATQSPCDPNKLSQNEDNKKEEKKRVSLLLSGPIGKDLPSAKSESKEVETKQVTMSEEQLKVNGDSSSEKVVKKRVSLISSTSKAKGSSKPIRTNLLTQFIKTAAVKYGKEDENKQDEDCVVLSD